MAKIKFKNGIVEDFTIVLSTKELKHLGQLNGITNVITSENLRGADEISFTVHKNYLNQFNHLPKVKQYSDYIWNNLNDLRLIWVKELDKYFQIQTPLDDSREDVVKNITAISLCEAELGQTMLYTTEINTEADIKRTSYDENLPTVFYRNPEKQSEYSHVWVKNENKYSIYQKDESGAYILDEDGNKILDEEVTYKVRYEALKSSSLLHRVLEKAPAYKITHVDASLANLFRVFSIDGTSIYDFLMGECSEQFNCLFIFNSANRTIQVYDLYGACCNNPSCNKRGDFVGECPECGGTDISYYGYGKDTTIYVDKNNLTEAINFSTDVDSIKNTLKLEAGDEVMTAAVRSLLQNGSDYITYFSQWQREQMPEELKDKLYEYDVKYNELKPNYQSLLLQLYDKMDEKTELEYTKFPSIEKAEVNATTEASKLTSISLSPVALTSLSSDTALTSINNAVKNYAKVLVMTGYVKVEIDPDTQSTFTYIGIDDNGYNYGTWTGKFKVTNYSDEEDIAYTSLMSIKIYDDYEEFAKQRVLKEIKSDDSDDGSIYDVLAIDDLAEFTEAIKEYNLSSLQSFYNALDGALSVLQEMEMATKDNEIYISYYDKMVACQTQINNVNSEVAILDTEISNLQSKLEKIQLELNIETFLCDLYPIFCTYKREDKYTNSNYVSDGLNNSQLLDRAEKFIEVAEQELYNSCEKQHTISAILSNLLTMKEFIPIVDYFEVGNWIRIKVDGVLYKLRLLGYKINFGNLQTIEVEFSNVTKVFNPKTQRDNLLDSVQSMATSYGTVSKQAESGNEANLQVNEWVKDGLNSALVQIKNNNNEEVIYGKTGLICRTYDDITESYMSEQLRLTHNILAYTRDNWQTVSLALGKHEYYKYVEGELLKDVGYGLTSDYVMSGFVYGTQIIGGKIFSTNYSKVKGTGTIINLDDSTFNFNNKLILDKDSSDNYTLKLKDGTIEGGSLLIGNKEDAYAEITSSGILNCSGANITGNSTFSGKLDGATGVFSGDLKASSLVIQTNETKDNKYAALYMNDGQFTVIQEDKSLLRQFHMSANVLENGEYYFGVNIYSFNSTNTTLTQLSTLQLTESGLLVYPKLQVGGQILCGKVISDDSIGIGVGYPTTTYSVYTTWADNASHNIVERADNGLTSRFGWAGSSSYSTVTVLRGQTCRYSNSSGTTTLSDVRLKENFTELDKWESFYNSLEPYACTLKTGNSGRYHMVFKAQQVEEALLQNGLTTKDFAGLIKMKYQMDEEAPEISAVYAESGIQDGDDEYGLIYTEFVAMNTHMIQKLYKRVQELETKLEQLGI